MTSIYRSLSYPLRSLSFMPKLKWLKFTIYNNQMISDKMSVASWKSSYVEWKSYFEMITYDFASKFIIEKVCLLSEKILYISKLLVCIKGLKSIIYLL